ncbi:MAG: hypothetical protein NZM43_08520 [Saprospiraceae bacterium]|nr:hypothetical protein [Saprospiraceae bacterium]MDW8484354.1 hypothetical protein [Saprospiraceae bacterium]
MKVLPEQPAPSVRWSVKKLPIALSSNRHRSYNRKDECRSGKFGEPTAFSLLNSGAKIGRVDGCTKFF